MLAVVYCYCSATNGIFRSESKALIFSFRNGLLFEITYVRFFFKKNAEYQVVHSRVLINKNITNLKETTNKLQRTYIKLLLEIKPSGFFAVAASELKKPFRDTPLLSKTITANGFTKISS